MNDYNSEAENSANPTSVDTAITPDTKIAALLKNHPDLEPVLIELSPAFSKLRNPMLRKTVAKIVNLRQAAQIGTVGIGKLINTLRRAAGQEELADLDDSPEAAESEPDWVSSATIKTSFDARALIESGGHPLNKAIEDVDMLADDEAYELITPFIPTPLIETIQNKGYDTWTKTESDDLIRTYFRRKT